VQSSIWVITSGCFGIWLECDYPELSICSQADATALHAPIPMNGPSQAMQQVPAFSMPNGAMSLPPLQEGIPAAMADNYQVSPAPGVGFCQIALQECVKGFYVTASGCIMLPWVLLQHACQVLATQLWVMESIVVQR